MYSFLLLISDVHPASRSFPMNSIDSDASSLNMCAFVAFLGSSGMSRLQVCIDVVCRLSLFLVLGLLGHQ